MTVLDGQVFDDHTPVDETEPIYDIRNAFVPTDGDLPPNMLQRFLQQPIRSITHRDTVVADVTATDQMIFNTWTGPNGTGRIQLPVVSGNEGRILRFQTDSSIAANKIIIIAPNVSDSGVTIDGASSYTLDRDYDGVSILCHASNWYIIQKKEK